MSRLWHDEGKTFIVKVTFWATNYPILAVSIAAQTFHAPRYSIRIFHFHLNLSTSRHLSNPFQPFRQKTFSCTTSIPVSKFSSTSFRLKIISSFISRRSLATWCLQKPHFTLNSNALWVESVFLWLFFSFSLSASVEMWVNLFLDN